MRSNIEASDKKNKALAKAKDKRFNLETPEEPITEPP